MIVNNQEIQAISSENNISCYDFHLYFNNEAVQLFESFFKLSSISLFSYEIIDDYTFSWNQFFQFMIIILFAPQIVIFYVLLVINSDYNGSISINDIIITIRSINDITVNRADIRKLFDYLDLNKDGYLTLNQFCNFISKSINYFENLITLRETIIDTVYPHSHILTILKRKLFIEKIRRYRLEHNNELPPLNCYNKIRMLIFNTPHPYDYNYDYNEISDNMINLHSLLCLFMRNFVSNYSFQKEVQSLPLKYLKIFKDFIIISRIDNYYIKFKEQSSVNTITSMSILSPFSIPRKASSANNLLNSKYNDNDSTPIIIAACTANTNGNTTNTGNTTSANNNNNNVRDTKGSLLSSLSVNQTRHCSILRKPSFANKIKHRSDVIPNYNSTHSTSIVRPTIDTSIGNSRANKFNNSSSGCDGGGNTTASTANISTATSNYGTNPNNKIGKSLSTDSNTPIILNVESRDDSPIYSFSPTIPPPSATNFNSKNNIKDNNKKENNNIKPNLRPISTSLNVIQVSHSNSNSNNSTTLPPAYPGLRPLASSYDEVGFNNNRNNNNKMSKDFKITSHLQRSDSSNGSVTIPGFISPSENEEYHYGDDDEEDIDMKV